MFNLRGIAWDDEPGEFMSRLQSHLRATYQIDLEIYDDRELFVQAFVTWPHWDFVVLDVFDERRPDARDVGGSLATLIANMKQFNPSYPIFLITGEPSLLSTQQTSRWPATAVIRFKEEPDYVAFYIVNDLRQRGVFVNRRRVFLIVNSAKEAFARYGDKVRQRLHSRNLTAVTLGGDNLHQEIAGGLLQTMNESVAIVSVCTPDDMWQDGSQHPRQNVLLEMGIAMGLSRGLERLIILRHEQAKLPSDLGGVLPINFADDIATSFPALEARLGELGIELT